MVILDIFVKITKICTLLHNIESELEVITDIKPLSVYNIIDSEYSEEKEIKAVLQDP